MSGFARIGPAAKTVEEAAAYWAARLDSPACTPSDRAAFEAWRDEKPVHAEAYRRVVNALTVVDRHLGHPELLALGEQVFEETEKPRRPLLRSAVTGMAAALTLAVGSALYFGWDFDRPAPPQVSAAAYETAVGERSTVTLPDGSTVVLNTASRVEVDYARETRGLTLSSGQALFEVAKDPDRPFVVTAGDRRIVALGTAFDVRVEADVGVQVTLIEGRVAVDEIEPLPMDDAEYPEPKRVELTAGEQLVAKASAPAVVVTADVERVVSWREGRLVFRDDPLPEAVREINRYSKTQVFVGNDPRLEAIRVSGVFQSGRTDSFVLALETVYSVHAQQVAEDRIALLWQE